MSGRSLRYEGMTQAKDKRSIQTMVAIQHHSDLDLATLLAALRTAGYDVHIRSDDGAVQPGDAHLIRDSWAKIGTMVIG